MDLIFIVGFFIAAILIGLFSKPRRNFSRNKYKKPRPAAGPWTGLSPRTTTEQKTPSRPSSQDTQDRKPFDREAIFLDVASQASYKKQRILHDQEFELFTAILSASRNDWGLKREIRVFPQVNLGEIMTNRYDKQRSPKFNALAQGAINSKRCDLLITCYYGHPRVAIELQGRRHDEDHKVMQRDRVKRLALGSAGIELVEIPANAPVPEALARIRDALGVAYPAALGSHSAKPHSTLGAVPQ